MTLSKRHPKLIYSYINSQRSSYSQICSLVDSSGATITEKLTIVNTLNSQFSSVFSPTNHTSFPVMHPRNRTICQVDIESFSTNKVKQILRKINKIKKQDSYSINPYIIGECADALAEAFSLIFCQSFKSGQLPNFWKQANFWKQVTPIFKKGIRTDPANYRPISLTAVSRKIMETIIRDIMMDHLIRHKLITAHQHGFVLNKSCESNLLETLDIITEASSRGFTSIIVFLDFAKAFDKESHQAQSLWFRWPPPLLAV
jgi:hypothetical protein